MNDKLNLLKRYFNNRYSKNDYLDLKRMLENGDPDLETLMQQHWKEFEGLSLPEGKDLSLIADQLNTQIRTPQSSMWKNVYSRFSKIAAILILPLIIALGFLYYQFDEYLSQKDVYVEISSPTGARTAFNLPDGSSVWLNGDSYIRYPVVFTAKRQVELKGEGFFKVQSDKEHPFRVSANGITVRATGTEFNVLAYEDDPEIRIILKEGKVEVSDEQSSVIKEMQPGYQLVYQKSTSSADYTKIDAESYSGWIDGKLIFENAGMEDVKSRMERWYGVKIDIEDEELLQLHFKATFMDESIEEALKLLQLTSTFNYHFSKRKFNADGSTENRHITITKN